MYFFICLDNSAINDQTMEREIEFVNSNKYHEWDDERSHEHKWGYI